MAVRLSRLAPPQPGTLVLLSGKQQRSPARTSFRKLRGRAGSPAPGQRPHAPLSSLLYPQMIVSVKDLKHFLPGYSTAFVRGWHSATRRRLGSSAAEGPSELPSGTHPVVPTVRPRTDDAPGACRARGRRASDPTGRSGPANRRRLAPSCLREGRRACRYSRSDLPPSSYSVSRRLRRQSMSRPSLCERTAPKNRMSPTQTTGMTTFMASLLSRNQACPASPPQGPGASATTAGRYVDESGSQGTTDGARGQARLAAHRAIPEAEPAAHSLPGVGGPAPERDSAPRGPAPKSSSPSSSQQERGCC